MKKFLLQEIIDELVNTENDLIKPLMKLNYFGRLTKNEELIDFTTKEISGYKNPDEEVPDYRKTFGRLMVDIQAHMNRHTVEVPFSMIQREYAEELRKLDVREGISGIEMMANEVKQSQENIKEFYKQLPMELIPVIQPAVSKLYRSNVRVTAVGAKVVGNGNIYIELPNIIRTRLLEFVMKIGDKFGYDIEIETFNKQENNQIINNYMATTINNNGDGNVINSGDNNSISSTISISKGDLTELQNELKKLGIEQTDVDSISEIVQREDPNDNKELGVESKTWIMGILEKSLNGAGRIVTGVSAHLLAGLIKGYYGIQ